MTKTFAIGDIVKGKVTGIQSYGIFVSLGANHQGLIHISEINHGFVKDIYNQYEIGEEVTAKIIDIDEYSQKISLSLRALQPLFKNKKPARGNWHKHHHPKDYGFSLIAENLPEWVDEGLANIQSGLVKDYHENHFNK
ncbi:CvfD/Ygs/GSP13 family RNA-binding post-transcriptional regulator [Aerococcus sp. UMB7834]|uniref:CvfD/Ygs/GSP13 family RNA-binding post-transcriptional regulator n=1 Tax=Aerococcus sp. UMB7834 TaxID=3046342 RepID=UPI00254D42BD|nr:CvfD/Ygs/GSP13 family RNA-binding post-transcriptional regulator [Aerococcus sp. UMB7834]MDK6804624.1 CvfD/Ygs/GSP13 family RNA-binding post-transcriptional regulator [Aerococcus sp. UMB7834]